MIEMAFTVLLVPCATKLLGAIGHHIRHKNNTHKHIYRFHSFNNPDKLHLHPTNYKLQTTNFNV